MGETEVTRRRWFNLRRPTISEVVIVAAIVSLLFYMAVWPKVERFRGDRAGYAEAEQDIADGHLRLRIGGYKTDRQGRLRAIAMDQFGIEIINRSCVYEDYEAGFSVAYNERMQQEFDRRGIQTSPQALWDQAYEQ